MCLAELPEPDTAPALTQEFCSNSHVSYWPVGALPDGGLADATRSGAPRFTAIAMPIASNQLALLNFFASGNAAETLHIWLQNLLKVEPNLAAKVRALPSAPTLLAYRYCEVGVNRCFQQRIVLLGDAAHAMSPQLGSGAGLALFDAWLSTQHITLLPTALALPQFERGRRAQVQRIRRISRVTTPVFQSAHPMFAALRESLFRMLAGTPRMQAMALELLCAGYKTVP